LCGQKQGGKKMKKTAFSVTMALGAMTIALFVNTGAAWADATDLGPHTGPDYISITGVRVGAPSEQEASSWGGSHKHEWVEQQLYSPGRVAVPHVDTSVHQSR
jgi:hypothetical protein